MNRLTLQNSTSKLCSISSSVSAHRVSTRSNVIFDNQFNQFYSTSSSIVDKVIEITSNYAFLSLTPKSQITNSRSIATSYSSMRTRIKASPTSNLISTHRKNVAPTGAASNPASSFKSDSTLHWAKKSAMVDNKLLMQTKTNTKYRSIAHSGQRSPSILNKLTSIHLNFNRSISAHSVYITIPQKNVTPSSRSLPIKNTTLKSDKTSFKKSHHPNKVFNLTVHSVSYDLFHLLHYHTDDSISFVSL